MLLISLTLLGCVDEVACEDACPQGTALASSAEIRSDSFQVLASSCSATCGQVCA